MVLAFIGELITGVRESQRFLKRFLTGAIVFNLTRIEPFRVPEGYRAPAEPAHCTRSPKRTAMRLRRSFICESATLTVVNQPPWGRRQDSSTAYYRAVTPDLPESPPTKATRDRSRGPWGGQDASTREPAMIHHHLQSLPEHRFLLKKGRTKFCTRSATALVWVPG